MQTSKGASRCRCASPPPRPYAVQAFDSGAVRIAANPRDSPASGALPLCGSRPTAKLSTTGPRGGERRANGGHFGLIVHKNGQTSPARRQVRGDALPAIGPAPPGIPRFATAGRFAARRRLRQLTAKTCVRGEPLDLTERTFVGSRWTHSQGNSHPRRRPAAVTHPVTNFTPRQSCRQTTRRSHLGPRPRPGQRPRIAIRSLPPHRALKR